MEIKRIGSQPSNILLRQGYGGQEGPAKKRWDVEGELETEMFGAWR